MTEMSEEMRRLINQNNAQVVSDLRRVHKETKPDEPLPTSLEQQSPSNETS